MGALDETFAPSKGPVVEITSSSRDSSPPPKAALTIWQRYFCKPSDTDSEKFDTPTKRRFSFLSVGSIVTTVLVLLILIAILTPVLYFFTGSHGYNRTHPQNSVGVPFNKNEAGPVNQAVDSNFADPFVLQHNGTWYAFATNNAVGMTGVNITALKNSSNLLTDHVNVQIATSTDFETWTVLDKDYNLLPRVGKWALQTNLSTFPYAPAAAVWAPALLQRPSDNKFVLYYSARDAATTRVHCVGAAVSDSITGPFEPVDTPLACDVSQGGSIDPAPFVDTDGSIYVAYKIDGNNNGNGGECGNTITPIHDTPIMLQRVQPDGFTPLGDPVQILDRIAADGPLVEAPSLVLVNGTYFLFYSSGCTRDPSYTVKYAYSSALEGPYTRADGALLMSGDWSLSAPGSATVAQCQTTGEWGIAFHARVRTNIGGIREMFTAGIYFNGTEVSIVDWEN